MSDISSTILVVDDDPGVTTAVRLRLEDAGFRCLVAHGGAQGLAQFQRHEPDLVVTDGSMPVGDGPTLVRAIRSTSTTPIVLLSGFASQYEAQMDVDENTKILQKPYDGDVLTGLVMALLYHADEQTETADELEDGPTWTNAA